MAVLRVILYISVVTVYTSETKRVVYINWLFVLGTCESEIFIQIESRIESAATIQIWTKSRIESGCTV